MRLNQQSTFLPLASYSTSQGPGTTGGSTLNEFGDSTGYRNFGMNGVTVVVTIPSSGAGTGSVTVNIVGVDVDGGTYLLLASAALTSSNSGKTVLQIYPSLTAVTNKAGNFVLPFTWGIQAVSNGTALKFGITYSLNP